jgi:putative ABC transport system substrate-binding protein
MREAILIRLRHSPSDNRKSKIQNRKWLGLSVITSVLVAVGAVAQAQQPTKIPRIGIVGGSQDANNPRSNSNVLRQGLRDLGYVEGKNILVELRSAEGKNERFPSLVAELVQLNVDVIVSTSSRAILAAKRATKTIPIVIVTNVDPVATGMVDSLAHPGGNVTGLTLLTRDLSGKKLELLKEVVSAISRVGILLDANAPTASSELKGYETAAPALKVQLQSLEVRGPNPDFPGAFATAAKGRVSALIAVRTSLINLNSKRIADLAIKNRLPAMFERSEYVETGGLVSYANNDAESFKRAAVFVDKILKGAKPADLPVEQPTKFELVINLKTAKQIGLTIPPNVLARADRVIK